MIMTSSTIEIPSNPKKREGLKNAVVEITKHMQKVSHENEAIKDILSATESTTGIKKKYIRKMAKLMYTHEYSSHKTENQEFEELYEMIIHNDQSSKIETDVRVDDSDEV